MFGIGMPELLLILAVALIVIGPKKLPDLARSLGKAMGEFKRATNDLKQSIEKDTGLDEVRQNLRETSQEVRRSFDAGDARPAGVKTNPFVSGPTTPAVEPEKAADEAAADAVDTLPKSDAADDGAARVKDSQ